MKIHIAIFYFLIILPHIVNVCKFIDGKYDEVSVSDYLTGILAIVIGIIGVIVLCLNPL